MLGHYARWSPNTSSMQRQLLKPGQRRIPPRERDARPAAQEYVEAENKRIDELLEQYKTNKTERDAAAFKICDTNQNSGAT